MFECQIVYVVQKTYTASHQNKKKQHTYNHKWAPLYVPTGAKVFMYVWERESECWWMKVNFLSIDNMKRKRKDSVWQFCFKA